MKPADIGSRQKIRIGICGVFGNQGNRLAALLKEQPDMELAVGIAHNDSTFKRAKFLAREIPEIMPPRLLMDEKIDAGTLSAECDVLVDAASWAEPFTKRCPGFNKPVITLDDSHAEGSILIAPPLMADNQLGNSRLFRLGDCIVSAIASLITPFEHELERIQISLLKNFEDRINGHIAPDMAGATFWSRSFEQHVHSDLSMLLGSSRIGDVVVFFRLGVKEYSGVMRVETRKPFAGEEIRERLQGAKNVLLLRAADAQSTWDIASMRSMAKCQNASLPPITAVVEAGRKPSAGFSVRFNIDSEAVGPFHAIDAVRMLSPSVSSPNKTLA